MANIHRVVSCNAWVNSSWLWLLYPMLTVVALAANAAGSDAPRWRMTQGKGYTVCEAFLKNLNAFPPTEPPMVCELKIHPTHPEFSRPQWEELDVTANLKLVYEAESLLVIFTPSGTRPKPFEDWEPAFQKRVAASRTNAPRLRRATVNLNGSRLESLLWYEWPGTSSCDKAVQEAKVVDSAVSFGGHILVEQRDKLMELSGLVATQGRTEVLLYRGRPYFVDAYFGPIRVRDRSQRKVQLGLHPVATELTQEGEYVVPRRCNFQADR